MMAWGSKSKGDGTITSGNEGMTAAKPKRKRGGSTGITTRDLFHESLEGVGSRPSRLFITLLGTVLGIASLVATLGLAHTAAGQIAANFDRVTATRVVIEPGTTGGEGSRDRAKVAIPWDGRERVADLVGVEEAAVYAPISGAVTVSAVQVVDPSEVPIAPPTVIAADPSLIDVVEGEIQTGRFFDVGHAERADRVVVLGANAAEKLGVNRVSSQPAIFINDRSYAVIGIIESVGVRSNLMDALVVPVPTARKYLDLSGPETLGIAIELGAGPVVARQAPIALSPNSPDAYKVKAPATANELQGRVVADVNVLFIAIGFVALIGGAIGIANVNLLSVSERRGEIGLRRALGATTRQIAQQFMFESLTTGILGGLIGVAIGLFVLLGVCLFQGWTPVIAAWVAPAGFGVGALVGLVSGTYPAIKAARIEPVDALRSA